MTEAEKGWVAGIIDGEGCIYCTSTFGGKYLCPKINVVMTNRRAIERLVEITGEGYVKDWCPPSRRKASRPMAWRWTVSSRNAEWLVREILPHMVVKHAEAEVLLKIMELNDGRHVSQRQALNEELKRLKTAEQVPCPI